MTARVAQCAPFEIGISVVTVEEQLSGWYTQIRKAKSRERLGWAYRHLADCVRLLKHMQIVDFTEATIDRYQALKVTGLKVGKMDLQIAATVLESGATLVTRKIRDFRQIPGLKVEGRSK